jgi:hypothetical protein
MNDQYFLFIISNYVIDFLIVNENNQLYVRKTKHRIQAKLARLLKTMIKGKYIKVNKKNGQHCWELLASYSNFHLFGISELLTVINH